jgi:hypothetical protein
MKKPNKHRLSRKSGLVRVLTILSNVGVTREIQIAFVSRFREVAMGF